MTKQTEGYTLREIATQRGLENDGTMDSPSLASQLRREGYTVQTGRKNGQMCRLYYPPGEPAAHQLVITLSGPQGAGKTTVAMEIYDLLCRRVPYAREIREIRLEDGEDAIGPKDAPIVIRTVQ